MAAWLPLAVALPLLAAGGAAGAASPEDLRRARTKRPRDAYRGDSQAQMSRALNGHLLRSELATRPCSEWSPRQLQDFMAALAEHRDEDLQGIYQSSSDRRLARMNSVAEHRDHWDRLNHIASRRPHLLESLQESLCRQAVMWWTHHVTDKKRVELRASHNVTVPLLPEGPKKPCGNGSHEDEHHLCLHVNEANSCDWCHSSQKDHDAGRPGTSVPDALKKFDGPDDGNPKGWDRKRRCDQDQMPRCQLCEGVGGRAWSDTNEDIELTPCEIVAEPEDVNMSTVAPPLYPKVFTSKRKDGRQGGYSDTLIGWKTDPFCFGFFPQNDSIQPLCYRSEDSYAKYYDIEREASRIEYTIHNEALGPAPNTTATILQVNDRMWIQNHLWLVDQCICADPSGSHCTNPPCHTYIHRWDTFETAQYLGREKINVEWIQDHGTGASGKPMELDHFILWTHHVWTDPVSRRLVRAWKPFNGLQVYDPEAWTDSIVGDADALFEHPPPLCKKGGAKIRINCDDDGNYHPGKSEGREHLEELMQRMRRVASEQIVV